MKDLNKMIGTIMKQTGFNYEFIMNGLSLKEFEDLYFGCRLKEKLDKKKFRDG